MALLYELEKRCLLLMGVVPGGRCSELPEPLLVAETKGPRAPLPSSTCGQYQGARVDGQGSDFNPRHPPWLATLVPGISTQLYTGVPAPVARRPEER